MNKIPTIKDVAEYLNISVSTVSRVMNGRDRVSKETRKRVLEAIEKLNYVPNSSAVSIITKQTKVIVTLVPDLNTHFFLNVFQGIEQVTREEGYFSMIYSTNNNSDEEYDFLNGVMGRSVDGVIIIPATPDLSMFKDYAKPFVFVDRFNDEYPYDSVTVDNFQGAYTATKHLIEMGHKKIALISGRKELNTGKGRFWGFEQAMRDHKVDINYNYIQLNDWSEKNGYETTLDLLKLSTPPSAIFAANANICEGVIKAARDNKIVFAKDLSLIGFDDNSLATFNQPQVTVIRHAIKDLGVFGATILLNKITKKNINTITQRITLPTELVIRGSVEKLI